VQLDIQVFFVRSANMMKVMLVALLLLVMFVKNQLRYGLWPYLALFLQLFVYFL
jgi:hypothetical protein